MYAGQFNTEIRFDEIDGAGKGAAADNSDDAKPGMAEAQMDVTDPANPDADNAAKGVADPGDGAAKGN